MATLFHYTNQSGYDGILETKQLNPSMSERNPNDVRYGNGQYLSDIEPDMKTSAQLSRLFLGHPFSSNKYTHYLEIDIKDLAVQQGRPHVFVMPNEQPLDLTERIVSHGTV